MWPPGVRALSAAEMSVVEENSVALGVSIDALMENAGRASAEEIARRLPAPPASVGIVAGTGNNGGDGFAAAFYLSQWGYAPEVWVVRPPSEIRSRPCRRCFDRIERHGSVHPRVPTAEELTGQPLVVDALLGTGQSGPVRGAYQAAVEAIHRSGAPVLSIDMPTGIGNAGALHPKWTVALTVLKEGMSEANAGEIIVRDIGIPPEAWLLTGPGEFAFLRGTPAREERTRHARILIIGGGPYAGAPALAALAALRSGTERATVLAPEPTATSIQAFSPNLVVRGIGTERFQPGDAASILSFVTEVAPEAIVMGMGAGRAPETIDCYRRLFEALPLHIPLAVDADALGALPPTIPSGRTIVATPNRGEYAREFARHAASPDASLLDQAREIARARGLFLMVKGEPDLLTDGASAFQNFHHHAAQTVSGVGDVVGGVLGSLLGQGVAPLHATRLASYWVGDAGVRAGGRRGMGLVATDVIEELPSALVAGLDRLARSA